MILDSKTLLALLDPYNLFMNQIEINVDLFHVALTH